MENDAVDRSLPPTHIQSIYIATMQESINLCWRGLCLVVPIVIDGIVNDRKRLLAQGMWVTIVKDAWDIWDPPSKGTDP